MSQYELLSKRLGPRYNCAHYICDAWLHETGEDITTDLASFLLPASERTAANRVAQCFRPLPGPAAPCVVLFRRAKATPHVGIYVRGRVLHLTDHGPVRQLLSVARVGYTSTRFYAHRKAHHGPI